MLVCLGKEKHEVNFDEGKSVITVDGVNMPVVDNDNYAYKCYKRPRQIAARNGINGLKKFFSQDLFICLHIYICNFILNTAK